MAAPSPATNALELSGMHPHIMGSCVLNCAAPVCKILHERWGIEMGLMTTVHASTAVQKTVDGPVGGGRWRDGRGARQNIIPSSSGVAKMLPEVLPALEGRIKSMAFRVPVPDVSVMDFTCRLERPATYKDIMRAMKTASEKDLRGILGYTEEELVSQDIVGTTFSSVFDAKAGMALNDNFIKVVAWFDNEYGFANRALDVLKHVDYIVSGKKEKGEKKEEEGKKKEKEEAEKKQEEEGGGGGEDVGEEEEEQEEVDVEEAGEGAGEGEGEEEGEEEGEGEV